MQQALDLLPTESQRLRSARRSLALAALGSLASTVLALTAAIAWFADWPAANPGALALVTALAAWWALLLRRAPRRWLACGQDLRRGRVARIEGPIAVRARRGFGLFALSHHQLLVGGASFALSRSEADQLRDGQHLVIRHAPRSGVLLAWAAPAAEPSVPVGSPQVNPGELLTPREAELLEHIARGLSDKEIARELGLEPATVRTYNSQLYAKLQARRRTDALARARALGLLTDVED